MSLGLLFCFGTRCAFWPPFLVRWELRRSFTVPAPLPFSMPFVTSCAFAGGYQKYLEYGDSSSSGEHIADSRHIAQHPRDKHPRLPSQGAEGKAGWMQTCCESAQVWEAGTFPETIRAVAGRGTRVLGLPVPHTALLLPGEHPPHAAAWGSAASVYLSAEISLLCLNETRVQPPCLQLVQRLCGRSGQQPGFCSL